MNPLEKTIALVSPRWAAERAYFRSVLAVGDTQTRKYNAARADRRSDGWIAPASSVNSELAGGIANRIRNRARDMVRNNPYAAGYPGMMASKVIGSGIQPRLSLAGEDTKEARTRARDLWDRFCDNCDPEAMTDFYGLQYLAARTEAESGEAIIRWSVLPASAKAPFRLQAVVQEGDFIDSMKTRVLDNGNVVIQGVEFNQFGHRVAYWLFDQHPGDSLVRANASGVSKRVDAWFVDHIFERRRPGQVRGVSPFASVVMKMRDLDDYDDAELMRKKVAACFAAFVKRPAGNATTPLVKQETDPGDPTRTLERLSPGIVKYMQPGEEMEFSDPPTADGYTDYHFGQLYAIAAGLECTFEQLTGNLRGVNFSSIRVGENRFQDLLDHKQWHVFIPQMCKKAWDRVGMVSRVMGDLSTSDPWTPRWIPPRRRWLDPRVDVKATLEAARSLQISPLDAIALSGSDPMEVLEETAEFNKLCDELGIISDMDPRKSALASSAVPGGGSSSDQSGSESDKAGSN